MFDIRFIDEPNPEDESLALGELVLGASTERFQSELTYWSRSAYEQSWSAALQHFATNRDRTVLITSYNGPQAAHHFAWNLWRLGDYVIFQERLYLVGEVAPELDSTEPWNSSPERSTFSEDGQRVSEWRVPLSDVLARTG